MNNELSNVDKPVDDSGPKPPKGGEKGGAPEGNRNSLRHGLTAGKLPRGAAYVARITADFRRALERAVAERTGGEISLHDAACIQTAVRWERHALLAQRWLRREAEELTPDQRLAFSRDVARASAERDRCLKALALDRDSREDVFDQLYSRDALPTTDHGTVSKDGDAKRDSAPT